MTTRYAIGPREIHKSGGHYGEESWTVCDISIEPHDEGLWVKWSDAQADRADLLAALKAMVASYDGLRGVLTCPTVIGKLARADAAIAKAEGRG